MSVLSRRGNSLRSLIFLPKRKESVDKSMSLTYSRRIISGHIGAQRVRRDQTKYQHLSASIADYVSDLKTDLKVIRRKSRVCLTVYLGSRIARLRWIPWNIAGATHDSEIVASQQEDRAEANSIILHGRAWQAGFQGCMDLRGHLDEPWLILDRKGVNCWNRFTG